MQRIPTNHIARKVLTLAGPGVVIATVLTACVVQYVFPYDWDWNTALMLGGMLSATDPVAVVALLKELGELSRLYFYFRLPLYLSSAKK